MINSSRKSSWIERHQKAEKEHQEGKTAKKVNKSRKDVKKQEEEHQEGKTAKKVNKSWRDVKKQEEEHQEGKGRQQRR
jgi:hypothetical protein